MADLVAHSARTILLAELGFVTKTVKAGVDSGFIEKLPDDCSTEDIQHHLYVIEKVRKGLELADSQGTISHDEVERRLGKWITE